jgi:YD repeat-containing protein
MAKKYSFLFVIVLCVSSATAQTSGSNFSLPAVVPNAPTASLLGRYGEIPVSINTGVPNISIPIFDIHSGDLHLPISLSYHASGIKVSDMSGSVGLGWSLNAGGCISRVVQGLPDESNQGSYGLGFSNMIFPQEDDPILTTKEKCIAAKITDPNDNYAYASDGQPDIFYYNFSDESGKFIYKNRILNGLNPGFMTIPYTPLQIVKIAGNGFSITDADGMRYIFSDSDVTQTENQGHYTPPSSITAWHITQIISADKTDTIFFKYISNNFSVAYPASRQIIQTLNYSGTTLSGTSKYVIPATSNPPLTYLTEELISEINFKNGKVHFNYTGNILNNIQIFNKKTSFQLIKQFTLFHSTFTTHSSTSLNTLRLDSLQEQGAYNGSNQGIPPYVFTYYSYNGDRINTYEAPPFNTRGQDLWGYFNGQVSNTNLLMVTDPGSDPSIPPQNAAYKRIPDSNYLKVGTLKSIKYPTGGKTTFDFEPNQTVIQKQTATTYSTSVGAYISESMVNYVPSIQFTIARDLQTSLTPDQSKTYNSTLTVSGYPMCTASSSCIHNDPTVYLVDLTGAQISDNGVKTTLISLNQTNPSSSTQLFYLTLVKNHTYELYFPNPVTLSQGQNYQNRLDATFSGKYLDSTVYTTTSSNILTGGLRIRSIISNDGFSNASIKKYKYTQSYFNSQLFNGDFDDYAMNAYKFQSMSDSSGSRQPTGCAILTPSQIFWTENSPLPLGSGGSSISYNEVEEYNYDSLGNVQGKMVYDYQKYPDAAYPNLPLFKIDNQYKRDRLIEERVYKFQNNAFVKQQDVVNNYEDLDSVLHLNPDTVKFYAAHAVYDNLSRPHTLMYNTSWACFGCSEYGWANSYLLSKYFYISDRTVLQSTKTTTYDNLNDSLFSSVVYEYSNPTHMLPTHISTTLSKGGTDETFIKYVTDYTYSTCSNSAYSNLQQQWIPIKQAYYSLIKSAFDAYSSATIKLNSCINTNETTAINAQNNFLSAQSSYDNSTSTTSQLIKNYNSALTTYGACVSGFYASASDDQKGIMSLQDQNNIVPVLQKTQVRNNTLLYTTQNFYRPLTSNVVKPSRIMFSTLNNTTKTRVLFDNYDNSGNILQQHKADDVSHAYIWDYSSSLPVAEAVNANQSDIAYTSFEADGKGNWNNYSGKITTVTGALFPPTGTHYYNLTAANALSKTVTNGNKYIVSYWSKNGSYTVIGGAGTVTSGNKINGWTFYYHVVQASSTTLVISGNGAIDEVRLYPVSAQMTTYTYEPLIGITCQSDVNDRITYYAYDGFGRLSSVKDQDGNIIKAYCYNYLGQLSNCQTSFQNSLQSSTFLKNDCNDPAYGGSEVQDTVAAGSFTSNKSQMQADSLAMVYLNSTGQSFANANGQCLPLINLTLSNYQHAGGFSIQFTSVYNSNKVYVLDLPADAYNSPSLQKIPQGHYNIVISKIGNTQSFLFTISGPAGKIQVNSDKGSWVNVPIGTNALNAISVGVPQ